MEIKNNTNKLQNSLKNDYNDSFINKIEINEYDLLKNKKDFNSNMNLEDLNNQKNLRTSSSNNNDNYYNKLDKLENFQEEVVYKHLLQEDDNNKYAIYNDYYIGNEDNDSMNLSNLYKKYFTENIYNENNKEKVLNDLKTKLNEMLFKSKVLLN